MATYYIYNKYLANVSYDYDWWMGGHISFGGEDGVQSLSGYSSFSFNTATGVFTVSGSYITIYDGGNHAPLYYVSGSLLYRYFYGAYGWENDYTEVNAHYTKGAYQTSVVAVAGAYPTNGVQGGYWYVRGAVTNVEPSAPSSIVVPATVDGLTTMTWTKGTDPEGLTVATYLELSTDGGSTYTAIGNTTVSSLVYNFASSVQTTNAKVRARSYDGAVYSGYVYSNTFTIDHPDPPTAPVPGIIGEVNTIYTIVWSLGSDPDGDALKTYLDLSLDGGSTYKSIGSTAFGATSFLYDFSDELATSNAKIRLRHYDGGLYGAYGYSNLFAIVHKVKIGNQKIQVACGIMLIPIYDPSVGMVGKNQLRINTPSGIGCYELVDVSAANASPLKVSTSGGIRAISK